jgi:hypothetical protein
MLPTRARSQALNAPHQTTKDDRYYQSLHTAAAGSILERTTLYSWQNALSISLSKANPMTVPVKFSCLRPEIPYLIAGENISSTLGVKRVIQRNHYR